jgi:phage terminase small subunit
MAGTKNSGRRRKDSTLHLLAGTYRADRHADRKTPDLPSGRPDKPATLSGEAGIEWDRMVARLELMQTLTAVDDGALYQYCLLFGETETLRTEAARLATLGKALRRELKKLEGAELVELVGKIVALEQLRARTLQQLRQGHMAIRQYLVEFGMTPSARTRVKALGAKSSGEPTPQDRLRARYFGGAQTSA